MKMHHGRQQRSPSTAFTLQILILVAIILLTSTTLLQFALCHQSFTIYRGIQYDRTLGNQLELGVRRTVIHNPLPISLLPNSYFEVEKQKQSSVVAINERSVLVLYLDQLLRSFTASSTSTTTSGGGNGTSSVLQSALLDQFLTLTNRNAQWSALFVVLPANFSSDTAATMMSAEQASAFKELELILLTRSIEKPICFVKNDQELQVLLDRVRQGDSSVQVTVNTVKEASTLSSSVKLVNFVGTLSGKVHSTSGNNKKSAAATQQEKLSLAIVANYDTLSAVPELTRGMSSTGSSVVGLLELARIFKSFYAAPATKPSYDLMFVLTSAGRLGYEGSRNWLKNLPASIRSNLQFVLCLENISAPQLNVHITQKTNDEHIVRLFRELSTSAKQMNIPLQFSEKALAAGKEASWEHEIFARNKIHAATISSLSKSVPQRLRTSTLDLSVNQTVVEHNIRVIADALVKFIYRDGAADDVSSKVRLNQNYIKNSLDLMSQHSRSLPFTTVGSPFVDAMRGVMRQMFAGRVQEDEFDLGDRVYRFYGVPVATLTVYEVKSMLFDLLIIVPTVAYLALLWFMLAPMRKSKE